MSYWKWESITLTNSLAEQILSAQEIFLIVHSFNYYSIGRKLSIPYETTEQRDSQSIDQNSQNFVSLWKWESITLTNSLAEQILSVQEIFTNVCLLIFIQSAGNFLSQMKQQTKRQIINWSKYSKYFCLVESERGTLANSSVEQILYVQEIFTNFCLLIFIQSAGNFPPQMKQQTKETNNQLI